MKKNFLFSFILFWAFNIFAQPADWQGKIETKNGVKYIHNPNKGLWEDDKSKELKITPVFSIGSLNASEEYLFSWVKDITTDSEGNIFACDSDENRIQVYDKNGKYIRTIGRTGHGPGELMRPMAVALDSSRKIYVVDNLNYRISIFHPNGKFFTSFKFQKYQFTSEYIDVEQSGNILLTHFEYVAKPETRYPIITKYDIHGNIVNELGTKILLLKNDGHGRPRYASYGFCLSRNSYLFVKSWYPYQIQIFKNDNPIKVIERHAQNFTVPEIVEVLFKPAAGPADKIKTVKERSGIWRLFLLPDGKFITVIRDAGKNFKRNNNVRDFRIYLDLFSKDGVFLKSYLWDWQKYGLIEHVDREGFFYTNRGNSEIVPGVMKWKVSF